ncbi:hypothetical protein K0504_17800 [Neiella marina]|uniref:Uncharacterized protein n=1 Tax=Neiella holothuriorum TaxID=2870530 RepID=A0ABS7EM04_9GAMM|nr:ABC transporter substrate binding protein [Neiella holothuriorum]MBW8192893.1 hypothetical protein [Neiella holothuriorum]
MQFHRRLFALLMVGVTSPVWAANILLIASYDQHNEWTKQCLQGIEQQLSNEHQLDVWYMDTKRLPRDQHQQSAAQAWQHFTATQPDLVMLADDNAVGLLAQKIAKTKTPVVFYGVNDNPRMYFENAQLPPHVHGVVERRSMPPFVRLIHQMVPLQHNKVLVMFDDSTTTAAYIGNSLRGETSPQLGMLKADIKPISTYQEWQATIRTASNSYDAIVMENWFTLRDAETQAIVPEEQVIDWSGAHSEIPIFTSQAHAVGPKKSVGAISVAGQKHGHTAAQMALDVLAGKVTQPLMISENDHYHFNQQALARFDLTLPPEIAAIAIYH